MNDIGLTVKWEESGLLYDLPEEDKEMAAKNLESMASDMVVRHSYRHRHEIADATMLPIIIRIGKKYGFREIKNVRGLYSDIAFQWERFILTPEAKKIDQKGDLEAEFCALFVERMGDRYF